MQTTDWYPAETSPVRHGWYHIQTKQLGCTCCHMDAYWNGSEFIRFGRFADIMNVYEAFQNVTRWRGLANPPKEPI